MTDACCRAVISDWWEMGKKGENAGLLRDRFLRVAVKDKKNHPGARRDLFDAMCQSLAQSKEIYRAAYERRKYSFRDLESKGILRTTGRLVIGLGGENVLETGLTLNHTYGTPMIPGTALKGLAAHYCNLAWGAADEKFKLGGKYHQAIFGTTEDSGHIIFHDAWIMPESLEGSLQPDVMTPHHGDYYSDDKGTSPPTDFDDPNPVTFLSVVGTFHVAVSCDVSGEEGQKWSKLAFELLSEALKEWGIGGKTNAGYGRMERITTGANEENLVKSDSKEQTITTPLSANLKSTKYKKGEIIEVTREPDPNIKRGNAFFRADDGFGGFVTHGNIPSLEIGQTIHLEVAGVMDNAYDFAVPGSRNANPRHIKEKGGRRR